MFSVHLLIWNKHLVFWIKFELWEVLKKYGMNGWLLKAIKTIYTGSEASVRVNGNCIYISQDGRQGCGLLWCWVEVNPFCMVKR